MSDPGPPVGGDDVFARVRRVVADTFFLDPEQVGADADPRTIEAWDSIQHLNLVLALEGEFGVAIPPEQADHLGSVIAIVAHFGGTPPASAPAPPPPDGVELRRITSADRDAVVALLRQRDATEYPADAVARVLCDLAPASWQGWIARVDGEPAGLTGFYLRTLRAGDQVRRLGYWSNLYVREDQRHLRLYPRLVHEMMAGATAAGIELVVTGMRRADVADAHVRLGFEDLCTFEVRLLPLRPAALLSRWKGLGAALAPIVDAAWGLWRVLARPNPGGVRVERAAHDSPEIDALLALRAGDPGTDVRLEWSAGQWRERFACTLEGWPYTLLLARRAGALAGGLVLRRAIRHSPSGAALEFGVVMDLIAAPGDAGAVAALVTAAEAHARGEGALALLWLDGAHALAPLIARCGFQRSPETYRMIAWPAAAASPDSPLRSRQRWRFTFADHDAF